MKTTTVARGFIGAVASLLGVVAVGCSAGMMDEGAAGEGEIGSVAEALTVALPSSAVRTQWDSCRVSVTVSGSPREMVLSMAGIDDLASLNVVGDIFLGDHPNNTFVTLTGTTSVVARSHANLVPDPTASNACVLVGGQDDAGSDAAISGANDKSYQIAITHNGTNFVSTVSNITGLTARSKLQVAKCGNNSLIALGGQDSGSASSVIQVRTAANPTVWGSVTNGTLNAARAEFGLAPSAYIPTAPASQQADRHFVAVGGFDTLNGSLASAEALVFNDDCTSVTKQTLTVSGGGSALSVARGQMVAFESNLSGAVSTIQVPGGFTSGTGTTQRDVDHLSVDWSATPISLSRTNTANVLPVGGVKGMKLARKTNTNYIFGGTDNSDNAVNYVAKVAFGGSTFNAYTTLSTAREGLGLAYLSTADKFQIIGGSDGTTIYGTSLEIAP